MADKILAVIPARGGSKRLPKKNVRHLDNRPLIVYSILAAQSTRLIDKVVVASEDDQILKTARRRGVGGFQLSEELTTDQATLTGTLQTVITNSTATWIVLLQPTCPLRQPSLITKWIQEVLNKPDCDGGLTVDRAGYKLGYCDQGGFYTPNYVPMIAKADGKRHWGRENGVFYMFKAENILNGSPFGCRMIPLDCPHLQSIANIDDQLGWDITEYLYHAKGYDSMFQELEKNLHG